MLFQYIPGELGIEALAYAQNSLFVRLVDSDVPDNVFVERVSSL